MTKYNVHLYCVVRVKIPDVNADSQVDAIERCDRAHGVTLHRALDGTYGNIEMEYAEKIVGALADEVGDDDFVRSGHYYKGQEGTYHRDKHLGWSRKTTEEEPT